MNQMVRRLRMLPRLFMPKKLPYYYPASDPITVGGKVKVV